MQILDGGLFEYRHVRRTFVPMNLINETIFLIKKEMRLEWRQKYAISGVLLYVLSTVFIIYISMINVQPQQKSNSLLKRPADFPIKNIQKPPSLKKLFFVNANEGNFLPGIHSILVIYVVST